MEAQRLIGSALTVSGSRAGRARRPGGAGDAYWEALAIWEALALPAMAAEARAGLARIAHANDAPSLALGFVEAILAQVARDPRLQGTEAPVEIFLTCHRVLHKAGDPRAAKRSGRAGRCSRRVWTALPTRPTAARWPKTWPRIGICSHWMAVRRYTAQVSPP